MELTQRLEVFNHTNIAFETTIDKIDSILQKFEIRTLYIPFFISNNNNKSLFKCYSYCLSSKINNFNIIEIFLSKYLTKNKEKYMHYIGNTSYSNYMEGYVHNVNESNAPPNKVFLQSFSDFTNITQ